MPRTKKAAEAVAQTTSEAAAAGGEVSEAVKKQRKENGWNKFYKEEYPKYKSKEENKGKTHSELTKAISADYHSRKNASSTPAAAASSQQE